MATRILLVRHGGTLWSSDERFAGSTDIDLSDEGRAQARALGGRLAAVPIDAAYCSPMRRTIETATLALGDRRDLPLTKVAGLKEIDHGPWEGQRHEDVERKYAAEYAAWDADPFMAPPPGGESGLSVLARALPALRQIVVDHPDQTVLVVSHKATNRLLLCSLMGIDERLYRDKVTQDLACLNVLLFKSPSQARVVLMNDTSHYQPLPIC
jgi:broad specificity phosphatase PhoE